MSTLAFIAAGLACGAAVTALFWALGFIVLGPFDTWQRRRLERRLELRLARGSDRYFEEQRSIEAALARSDRTSSPASTMARAIQFILLTLVGMLLFSFFLSPDAKPDWARLLPNFIFIVIGAQWAFGVVDPGTWSMRTQRTAGVGTIILFSVFTVLDIYRFT